MFCALKVIVICILFLLTDMYVTSNKTCEYREKKKMPLRVHGEVQCSTMLQVQPMRPRVKEMTRPLSKRNTQSPGVETLPTNNG